MSVDGIFVPMIPAADFVIVPDEGRSRKERLRPRRKSARIEGRRRHADSLSLRTFLGIPFHKTTPDHSSLSIIRHRFKLEAHQQVFTWIVELLAKHDLVHGKTVGIDTTTLEANAAMRSIVRRDTGESYDEFLTKLAKASGIETPTKSDLIALVNSSQP